MSNRAIRRRFEDHCKKYLESVGFVVDKARAALKFAGPGKFFSSSNDFFGCADLIGVHPDKAYSLFVQCHLSSNPNIKRRQQKMEAVPWNLAVHRVELWLADGRRGGMRTFDLVAFGWKEILWKMKHGEEPLGVV